MLNFLKATFFFYSFSLLNILNYLELDFKFSFPDVFKGIFLSEFSNLDNAFLNSITLEVEYIKVQELSFLPEYFLITALFCLTLFFLFSSKWISNHNRKFHKFRYENSFMFLLIFILFCYLVALVQQMSLASLTLTSFNDTIQNDLLSLTAKLFIGLTSILYLIFINKFLKDQKLNNFEYYIILLVSIFGFFLLCCANDFITCYLAIELQGLAFYVLASFKKSSNFSVESGVKYFVLGSLSTALFLFGITMIYGLCGSVSFSDFRDFFTWALAANSFFFTFDFLSSSLDFHQESLCLESNDELEKLKMMYDKLNLLEENVNLKLDIWVPIFEKTELVFCGVQKFSEAYYSFSSNLFLSVFDKPTSIDFSFLELTSMVSSINDFLIENAYQNSSADLFYTLKSSSLSYSDFLSLKMYLFDSNYYEDVSSENFYGFSHETPIKNHLLVESNLSSLYELLDHSYYSDSILNNIELGSSSEKLDLISESLSDKVSFYENLQNSIVNSEYLFSLAQLLSMNTFFSEIFEINAKSSEFVFDLSYLVIGFLIVLFALFFKLALAPFHLWSPDVYEGSPSSSTFFFMVLSKFGIFILLFRLCYSSFYSLMSYWQFYSLIIASISIFVGAFAGLKQRKLKSLLTYSSINNMGFVLLAFSTGSFEGVQISFYYLIVYMLASVCIWAFILNMSLKKRQTAEKQNRDLGDLALLQESNHTIAQGLGITLFSLAGLPPMVGFLAKMSVFKVLSGFSLYYVSVINILFSIVATFYYLRIIKIIFFENFLVGALYSTISSKSMFILNLLTFLLVFFFFNPVFLYLYSYKITLFLNGSFF